MTFRATRGSTQLGEEILNYFVAKKQFFDVGYIFEFFYDAYISLWRGGLEQEMRSLKYKYPDYELWVSTACLEGLTDLLNLEPFFDKVLISDHCLSVRQTRSIALGLEGPMA